MALQARHRWIIGKLSEGLGIRDEAFVESVVKEEATLRQLDLFLGAHGPVRLLFFFQTGVEEDETKSQLSYQSSAGASATTTTFSVHERKRRASGYLPSDFFKLPKQLFLTDGISAPLTGHCMYFVRTNAGRAQRFALDPSMSDDGEITFGTVTAAVLKSYEGMLAKNIKPLIESKREWNHVNRNESREFCSNLNKFTLQVNDFVQAVGVGVELVKPKKGFVKTATKSGKLTTEMLQHFVNTLSEWCNEIECYLEDHEGERWGASDKGPRSEIEHWKRRSQRLNSLTEQLKTKECRVVISVLQSFIKAQSTMSSNLINFNSVVALLRRWRQIDINITEAANEAKDNVKYLTTVEKAIDPLYNGTPVTIMDSLPALMNSVKMIHTIARYYNTTENMTMLFAKITNQMIQNCRQYLISDAIRAKSVKKVAVSEVGESSRSTIWDKDPQLLCKGLQDCLKLNQAYQEQYHLTKEKVQANPKGRQFDFSEAQIFGKFDLFCKRVVKLIDFFSTIQQFENLTNHSIEGMDKMVKQFRRIVLEFRGKQHDLLDFYNNRFDRDHAQFNMRIAELESQLQGFINRSFESIVSIEASLSLLRVFENILQRENLKADLDSKLMLIFQNYGLELTTVQDLYEKQKHSPPIGRNMPPVAGSILWARHLLRRIEEPMRRFESNGKILASKDSRKIIKTYNKVAKTLVAFEYLWYEAWCNSIESARAGLQATLIIRDPKSRMLYVNFDAEILQLIREAKALSRLGIEIPSSAKLVLLQEKKFKEYHQDLSHMLREYERVLSMTIPITKEMLQPHIHDLELAMRPGLVTLTWSSMNIDAYKHVVSSTLKGVEELISNVNDIIENRIEKNLKKVGRTFLVDLPSGDGLLSLDEFVQKQESFINQQMQYLGSKNREIEVAVLDVIQNAKQYKFTDHGSIGGPLPALIGQVGVQNMKQDTDGDQNREICFDDNLFRYLLIHYNNLMYHGLMQATKASLEAIKKRVCAKGSTGFLYLVKPFFEVDVQLSVPSVRLVPSLDEIQNCINKCAQSILWSSKSIPDWRSIYGKDLTLSFFEKVSRDVDIVPSLLLLTGALLGTKQHVRDYLSQFSRYDWLWKDDMELMYRRFVEKQPNIEEFEAELSRFVAIETEIRQIPGVHNIGALSLNTSNLKLQLQSEASQWKVQYSERVHQQASESMQKLIEYIHLTQQRCGREVNSLESLRFVMNVLKEIRERESTIEQEITPILDMYDMLEHYLPAGVVDKEEMDKKSILRSSWRKLGDFAEEVTDRLAGIQDKFKAQLTQDVRNFAQEVASFRATYIANGPIVAGLAPKEAVQRLRRYKAEFELRARKQEILSAGEELFAMKSTTYPELTKTRKELVLLDQLYSLYIDVVDTMEKFREQQWHICVNNVSNMAERVAEFEARCKKLPVKLQDWEAFEDLRADIADFQNMLPLLLQLSKPSIKDRHWDEITDLTGIDFDTETSSLRELWNPFVLNRREEIEEICRGADKEMEIEERLYAMKAQWATRHFTFVKWRERDCCVLKGFAAIVEDLEESQLNCQGLLAMRHISPFKVEVSQILSQLSETGETLELWLKVQLLWTSLESVLMGGDIARKMPRDAKKFAKIDKEFIKIMERAHESRTNVVQCCSNEMLKVALPSLYVELERCQKSLEGYLEQKRSVFPRFYFVSNPVLLQILSQGSDPENMQEYFEKVFEAIDRVTYQSREVTEMKNSMGQDEEVIPLTKPVLASGSIEDWLFELECEMKVTMREACRLTAEKSTQMDLLDFVEAFSAQFALLGLQMNWVRDTEEALAKAEKNKNAMSEANKKQLATLTTLSNLCLKHLGTDMNRKKIETLVTIQVHQRDIFADLLRLYKDRRVSTHHDFEWQKQARVYWNPSRKSRLDHPRESEVGNDDDNHLGSCTVSVCETEFEYGYEYLGCKERLVVTPLTDRCYVSLTQAMSMQLGGASIGPAGTGKTETVKDLGRTLGMYVVVTNCTDQQHTADIAKILKGLCRAGVWGCFDEFNRIELPVLSVVAQQLLAITTAKRMEASKMLFPGESKQIPIFSTAGVFVTMNPGYAGRKELPENLKTLFRTIAMMVPDREIIIRVKLCSSGYLKFSELAKKFNALYIYCEEQLSQQKHYDFGLRNILAVLRSAGQVKRDNQASDEQSLLMETLKEMNLSKLVATDAPIFLKLLQDLFPGINCAENLTRFDADLERTIQSVVKGLGLQPHAPWMEKILQLAEMSKARHGLIVIGPPCSGKTKCLEVLVEAMSQRENVLNKIVKMNPKAITVEEMFGVTEEASKEWIDGIFSVMWQKFNERSRRDRTWLTCDGPVDSLWVENLNTVLDDNKILTLANGDRIPMCDNVRLVFETQDLNSASPATVSRAGIVYISAEDLGWQPLVESWISMQHEAHRDTLRELIDFVFVEGNFWSLLTGKCALVLQQSQVAHLNNFLRCLTIFIGGASFSDSPSDAAEEIERLFLFALICSFGSLVEATERSKFDALLRNIREPCKLPKGLDGGEDNCFHYFIDLPKTNWTKLSSSSWKESELGFDVANEYIFRESCASMRVGSAQVARYSLLLELLQGNGVPTLLLGTPGGTKTTTGKLLAHHLLGRNENMSFTRIPLSASITPRALQEAIEGEIEKRGGRTYGPAGGKVLTVFLDDMHLPRKNDWGDQPALELVRQLVETQCLAFLDKDKRGDFKTIEDVRIMGAASHFVDNSQDQQVRNVPNVPARLFRHFLPLCVDFSSTRAVQQVFGTVLSKFFEVSAEVGLRETLCGKVSALTSATMMLWSKIKTNFRPTPANCHYQFTLRDVSRVVQGIVQVPICIHREHSPNSLLPHLWRHEVERVFADRLTTPEEVFRFQKLANDTVAKEFGASLEEFIDDGSIVPFASFLRDDLYDEDGALVENGPLLYEPGESFSSVTETAEFKLEDAEKEDGFVLFRDTISHLLRATRALASPRGNLLLLGVGGCGKKTIAKLAAFLLRMELREIALTRNYSVSNFLDEMRTLFKLCGVERKQLNLLLTDAHIKDEAFLEIVNSFLSSGHVVGLFPRDELAVMAAELRFHAVREWPGFVDIPENLFEFFSHTVRSNLRVTLCVSPSVSNYSERMRKFPGLFANCTIDWYLPWPRDALMAVAEFHLEEMRIECSDAVRRSFIAHASKIHEIAKDCAVQYKRETGRHVSLTPRSFLAFLGVFQMLYTSKLADLEEKEERVHLGLMKLARGAEDVDAMKADLALEEKKLQKAEEACNEMLSSLEASSMEAKSEAEAVSIIKSSCEREATSIKEEREMALQDLEAAKPFLDEAERAVNSIKPQDLNELKKLPKPGDIIKLTFDCVMILRKYPIASTMPNIVTLGIGKSKRSIDFLQDSYSMCQKSMLADSHFLKALFAFSETEKDDINNETVELLMPYLDLEEFRPAVARNASRACEGLCTWVIAMVKYHEASTVVKPKLEKLGMAESKLEAAQNELALAEAKLKGCKKKLEQLQDRFQGQMSEKAKIEARTTESKRKMEHATALIEGLKVERARWTEDGKVFAQTKKRSVGDCAVASAFLSYAGPFNERFRELFVRQRVFQDALEKKIPVSVSKKPRKTSDGKTGTQQTSCFDLIDSLADEVERGEWKAQGLPSDQSSIENGIIMSQCSQERVPLLIDPQGQGLRWIRNRERANLPDFGSCNVNNARLRERLEFCMAEGKTLILTGVVDEVDPILTPVLKRETSLHSGEKYVSIAGKHHEMADSFLLILVTRLAKPRISADLQAKTNLIDFTVTEQGLEEQLLGHVIKIEQRALEDQLGAVLHSVNENTRLLHDLNEQLLERLTENSGNLLEDDALVSVLSSTKKAALDVIEQLQEASKTQSAIALKREQYRPIATRGCAIYFAMSEIVNVNPMYHTSLEHFLRVFHQSITQTDKSQTVSRRVAAIVHELTLSTYRFVEMGLYRRDKLTFVMLLLLRVLVSVKQVKREAVVLLLYGGLNEDMNVHEPKSCSWISDLAYKNACALSRMVGFFSDLPFSLASKQSAWHEWYTCSHPETAEVPDYEHILCTDNGSFLRLLLVRCLREDRFAEAAWELVRRCETVEVDGMTLSCLGPSFATMAPNHDALEVVYNSMTPVTPALCLLSSGSNPASSLASLCKRKKQNMTTISLGEGQEERALAALQAAQSNGECVLIQNCHIDFAFVERVNEMLENLRPDFASAAAESKDGDEEEQYSDTHKGAPDLHPNFRLFLTTEPVHSFPVSILQQSFKITDEPPAGLKAGMMQLASRRVDQEILDRVDSSTWRKAVYAICFLHAVSQERHRFGALGWSKPYEFNVGDLMASLTFLERHLLGPSDISWQTIQYMVGEVHYGGRITDDVDRKIIGEYTKSFLQAKLLQHDSSLNLATNSEFVFEVPDFAEIDHYFHTIAKFPEKENCDAMGLHASAEVAAMSEESSLLLQSLLVAQMRRIDDSSSEIVADLSQLLQDYLASLPEIPSIEACERAVKRDGGVQISYNIILQQEHRKLSEKIAKTRRQLKLLQQAIRGEIQISQELEEAISALSIGNAPSSWIGSEQSTSTAAWLSCVIKSAKQLTAWITKQRPPCFWIGGFENPQGLLTAILQEVARKDKSPMESLTFSVEITNHMNASEIRSPASKGYFVQGLQFQGCGWNTQEQTLDEPEPNQASSAAPVLQISAILKSQQSRSSDFGPFGGYNCPVYIRMDRKDHIANLRFASKERKPSHWTLRGAAAFIAQE